MEAETYKLIAKLWQCTFLPATPEKRFINQVRLLSTVDSLSERQLMYLGQIRYRFRKQLEAMAKRD